MAIGGLNANAFFIGLIIAVLLVIGGIEINPGPPNKHEQKIMAEIKSLSTRLEITIQAINANFANATQDRKESRESLQIDIVCVKEDIKATNKLISDLTRNLSQVTLNCNTLSKECQSLRETNKTLEQQVSRQAESMELMKRKNNIVVFGVEGGSNESWDDTENVVAEIIKEKLNVDLDGGEIERARRLGQAGRGNRPILVELLSSKTKMKILKNSKQLKGTKINIDEDFSPNIRAIRGKLIPFLRKARQDQCRAHLRYDKLMVDGKFFTLEEIQVKYPNIQDPNIKYPNIAQANIDAKGTGDSSKKETNQHPGPMTRGRANSSQDSRDALFRNSESADTT